ncbi:MAG TPA: glycosyltransferase [Bryobacteraceae bacterium]|nr:glycosyltransferase [Bryobacteraceae bacterium]
MPAPADLIRVIFASGNAQLNRDLVERAAQTHSNHPLIVVAEFEPAHGEWVAWHPFRGYEENLASLRAAIGDRKIASAAMALCPGVPLAPMRRAARAITGGTLMAYDEKLRIVRGLGRVEYTARRILEAAASARAKKWLRRVAHPKEAEIPLRARAAQLYGLVASRTRGMRADEPTMAGLDAKNDGVTVVIPSRNGRELLATLLPHLLPQIASLESAQDGPSPRDLERSDFRSLAPRSERPLRSGEILVSDNGSSDGTAEWLAATYPTVRAITNERPLSFATAVNAGIRAARFKHTLLLNNDMIVAPGFVDALLKPFATIPDLFCATAQIFFPPGIRREETGKAVWRQENPLDFPVRCDDPLPGEDLTWVLYGSGGCSLFDTQKLRALGGVSEIYDPAYVEDLDFGYRAWRHGWSSVFCASAQVEHRHRATTSRYYTRAELDVFVEINYLRFLANAVSSDDLFRRLWRAAIRRLQLNGSLETLRRIPGIGPRPVEITGTLSEEEILALGGGDIAIFPGTAGNRPVVVIASPYVPFPLSHGGAVRIFNLMKHAAADYDQVLVAFTGELETPPAELLAICAEVILVRRHGSHYRRETSLPDVVEEFASLSFRATLKQTMRRWHAGVVQLEFTQMAQYADACAPAKTILVEHDITFDLQRQLVNTSTESGAAQLELRKQLDKWTAFETAAWKSVDCVVTMSGKDEQTVAGARRVACIPNGVDTVRFNPTHDDPDPRRLLFVGSFAHLPNLLALEFFLRDVWPLLEPAYTLHVIAGARHDYFLDFYRGRVRVDLAQPRIELEGFVADVRAAYQRAALVLAPLTASAGTNIKVLEAMAMGRVVVSTTAGINGLDLKPGVDVVVTDSAGEMAERIEALAGDPAARKSLERNARETALRYDWREIAGRQSALYPTLSDGLTAELSLPADSPA